MSPEELQKAEELCVQHKGVCPNDCEVKFEDFKNVFNRAKAALLRYSDYNKIIVVSHRDAIRRFVHCSDLPRGGIVEMDFDESCKCTEFYY